MLLELPSSTPEPTPLAPQTSGPSRSSLEGGAKGKDPKKPGLTPPAGTGFRFDPKVPKYVTVDLEVRDQAGKLWPSFLCGKPVSGTLTVTADEPSAKFVVSCPTWCQPAGEQTRRVLGELLTDPKSPPVATFTLDSLEGKSKTLEVKTKDAKGNEKTKAVEYYDSKATLELAGKKVAVTPRTTIEYVGGKDGLATEAASRPSSR